MAKFHKLKDALVDTSKTDKNTTSQPAPQLSNEGFDDPTNVPTPKKKTLFKSRSVTIMQDAKHMNKDNKKKNRKKN